MTDDPRFRGRKPPEILARLRAATGNEPLLLEAAEEITSLFGWGIGLSDLLLTTRSELARALRAAQPPPPPTNHPKTQERM